MKLKVGKLYVTRDEPDVKYVRVDGIVLDREDDERVDASVFWKRDAATHRHYYIDGRYFNDELSESDIVAEYKEPEECPRCKELEAEVKRLETKIGLAMGCLQ